MKSGVPLERRTKNTITERPSIKEKFAALKNLPRFFALVWQTNRSLTIANALLRIAKSAMPVAILYVGKLIIDEVVLSSTASPGHSST